MRQPLSKVLVKTRSPDEVEPIQRLFSQISEELNVKSLELVQAEDELVDYQVTPNVALLGPKYGKMMADISRGLAACDPGQVVRVVRAQGEVKVGSYTLLPEEVIVATKDKPELSAAAEGDYAVAVTIGIPEELAKEGLAREIVHRLQIMRRSAGFDVADHIVTYVKADGTLSEAIDTFDSYICQETLSTQLMRGDPPEEAYVESHKLAGAEVVMGVVKVSG